EAARGSEEVEVPVVVAEECCLHVFQSSEATEDARDLKRTAHAASAQALRRQTADLLAGEVYVARVVGDVTGDQVEERGLRGAVGADARAQGARRHCQVPAIHGLDAAEVLAERAGLED